MPPTGQAAAPRPAEPVANIPPPPESRRPPQPVAPEFEVVDWTGEEPAEPELAKALDAAPIPEKVPEPAKAPMEEEVEVEVSMSTPRHKLMQVAKAMGLKFGRKATKPMLLEMIEGAQKE